MSSNGTADNTSLCYKNGPKLPALDFTTPCITSGRYIKFYNERLHEDTYPDGYVVDSAYTEICKVIVHGKNIHEFLLVLSCFSPLALKVSLESQIHVNL